MPPVSAPEIRVEDIYKAFDDHVVLRGVTLEIGQGDLLAIVGESGGGKSVLVEIMTGQMIPDRGQVLVARHDLPGAPLVDLAEQDEESMDRIRTQRSIVFQRNALYSGTVYENVALWLREVKGLDEARIERTVRQTVERVGLDADRVLEESRDELSGGMAKRVAIARALAMEPRLMFYDEPTTGLDPRHAHRIIELIHASHAEGGRTTIVVTHDKELLERLAPRIVMLHEGRVFFDGTYADFARSRSSIIRPYVDRMPGLHGRPPPAPGV